MRNVTELRGWPTVGETYLVPSLRVGNAIVPVHPEPHTDDETPEPHFHVDARFVSTELETELASNWPRYSATFGDGWDPFAQSKLPIGLRMALNMGFSAPGRSTPKAALRPMVCRYSTVQWDMPPRDEYWLERKYLPIAPRDGSLKAIMSADGRPLCPHQKFDLTCVWDGASSHVRCPLHGLLVKVA